MTRRLIQIVAVVSVLVGAAAAYAYWTASGGGTGSASVGTLGAPAISVPSTSTGSVTVTWASQATISSPASTSGITYIVSRKTGTGSYQAISSGPCSGSVAYGTTSCVDSVSSTGTYTYKVTARYGNPGGWTADSNEPSTSATVVTGPSAPTITGTTPASPSNDTTPKVVGTAAAGTTVKVYTNSTCSGSPIASGSAATFASPGIAAAASANATTTFYASATDTSSNVSPCSSGRAYLNDSAAPAPTITTAPGAYTSSTTPTLAGAMGTQTADSTHSADAGTVTVTIYNGSDTSGTIAQTLTATYPNSGQWSATAAALAPGQYTAKVAQTDAAGNAGSATSTFTIDTTSPSLSINAPAAYMRNTTPSFSGAMGTQAADATHSADAATVTVRVYQGTSTSNANLVATLSPTYPSSGQWSAVVPAASALTPGQYTLRVNQSDGAGNTANQTATFTVETTAPAVTLSSPADSATTGMNPTFTGTAGTQAADATHSADASTVTVHIFSGASEVRTLSNVSVSSGGAFSVAIPATNPLGNGIYTWNVTQTDDAGNTGTSATRTLTVNAPSVTLSNPSNGGAMPTVGGNAWTFKGSASKDPTASSVTVRVFDSNGNQVRTATATPSTSNGNWSTAPISPLPAGQTYTWRAEQSDSSGRLGISQTQSFTT